MTTESGTRGELLVAISNTVVAIYKELYGKGPVKVRSWYMDDLVVCVLRGGLTRSEQTFVEIGRGDRVALQRESFHEAAAPVFVNAVEQLLGRRVETVLHAGDALNDLSTLTFLLEPPEAAALRDTGQGLINQGRQMRKRAAVVREEARSLREHHEDLKRLYEGRRRD